MGLSLREIKELARRFSPEQMEGCIGEQIKTGSNVCIDNRTSDEIISELAKAEFVRELMEKGMDMNDAVRELAKRIRQFQEKCK